MAIKAVLKENSFGNKTRVKTGKVRISFPHLFEVYEKSARMPRQTERPVSGEERSRAA